MNRGMRPSWTSSLLQSASGALARPSPHRLSWDSFTRALPPTSPPRVHSQYEPKLVPSVARCQADRAFRPRGFSPPRRLSPRNGSRCFATGAGPGFAALPAPHTPTAWRTRPGAASAPFPQRGHPSKNSSPSTAAVHLSVNPCPPAVAARTVQTRRPFPCAWPTTGRYSADVSERLPSLLPASRTVRVLPWASVPATHPNRSTGTCRM
jgi:hypothetical protein